MNYDTFLASFTDDQILDVFPVGLRTPEAIIGRIAAYNGPIGIRPAEIVAFLVSARDDDGYKPGVGHRRACTIPLLSIVAQAAKIKNSRPLTDRMNALIQVTFNPTYTAQLIALMSQAWDTEAIWLKDDKPKTIQVPADVANNPAFVRWIALKWAPPKRQ